MKRAGVPTYMTRYWTTMWGRAYYPSSVGWSREDFLVMWHEAQHAWAQAQQGRLVYAFCYLFPASLAIPLFLGALATPSLAWLWVVSALIAMMPLESKCRTAMEVEAYAIQLAVIGKWQDWKDLRDSEWYRLQIEDKLAGPTYYRCAWTRDYAAWLLQHAAKRHLQSQYTAVEIAAINALT